MMGIHVYVAEQFFNYEYGRIDTIAFSVFIPNENAKFMCSHI